MINTENNKIVSFIIWLLVTMFFCYQQLLRALPNIMSQDIMANFNIGASELGSFGGIYYVGYVALHIPVGILLSQIGARKILPIFIALTAIGLAPLVYNFGWNSVIIGRLLTGCGSAAATVGSLQIFRILYPDKFGRMIGLMVSLGLIIAVYGGGVLGTIILDIGSKVAVSILLYLGIILAIFIYIVMPKSTEETSHSNLYSDVRAIIFNYRLLFTSLFAGLMVGPVEGFADLWGSSFLMNVYNMDKILADSLSLSIFLGMSAGCIILPYIAEKTGYYFGVTIASGIGMVICFAYMLTGSANIEVLRYICIIIGIFCAYQVVILVKIASFVSEERSGLAGAVGNMIIMIFGSFFHNAIGITLDNSWTGQVLDGVKQYSTDAFIFSISIIPTAICVAVIGLSAIAVTIFIRARKIATV